MSAGLSAIRPAASHALAQPCAEVPLAEPARSARRYLGRRGITMAWRRIKGAQPLGLPKLLAALGAELREAHATAEREGKATAAWTSATVEIDVAVEVSTEGGVAFYVKAEGAAGRTRTTKITLNLEPVDVVSVPKPSEKPDVVP